MLDSKRPGVISFEVLTSLAPSLLKQYLLLYDEFYVPELEVKLKEEASQELDEETSERLASIEYLISKDILRESPISLNPDKDKRDQTSEELLYMYSASQKIREKALKTRGRNGLLTDAAARKVISSLLDIDFYLSRFIVYSLWKDQEELGFPVFFPFKPSEPADPKQRISKRQNVLSVIINNFPEPDPDLPLEDIVAFKLDEETKQKYRRLWTWVRTVSEKPLDSFDIAEEIEHLLTDYSYHLNRLSKRKNYSRFQILATAAGDVLENVVKMKFGAAIKTAFELRNTTINAADEELKLPGSELAYLKEASDLLHKS